ncbi:MAG: hypothetical protein K0Q73_2885 [Paenibacillus sp.]|jgi:hypothetical protein|nr:hypothetical protein [Paenibacillus sp.]
MHRLRGTDEAKRLLRVESAKLTANPRLEGNENPRATISSNMLVLGQYAERGCAIWVFWRFIHLENGK